MPLMPNGTYASHEALRGEKKSLQIRIAVAKKMKREDSLHAQEWKARLAIVNEVLAKYELENPPRVA